MGVFQISANSATQERLPRYPRRFTRHETPHMAGALPRNSAHCQPAWSPSPTLPTTELLVSRLGTSPKEEYIPFLSTLRSCGFAVHGPTKPFNTSKHSRSSASFFACRCGLESQADDSSRCGTIPPRRFMASRQVSKTSLNLEELTHLFGGSRAHSPSGASPMPRGSVRGTVSSLCHSERG